MSSLFISEAVAKLNSLNYEFGSSEDYLEDPSKSVALLGLAVLTFAVCFNMCSCLKNRFIENRTRRDVDPKTVITELFKIIEKHAKEEGVYRISSKHNERQAMLAKINAGDLSGVSQDMDIHLAAGIVKEILRDMPSKSKIFPAEIPALETIEAIPGKIALVQEVLTKLSPEQRRFLHVILDHIEVISAQRAINKMTASNLAIVFAPNLFANVDIAKLVIMIPRQNAFFEFVVLNREALGI